MSRKTYEQEQEDLRKKYEGEQGEQEDVKIDLPSKGLEVNPAVYRDVEPMIFRGFITLPVTINGVDFVFKSLNQHEFDLIQLVCGSNTSSQRFYDLFLAYGVFMIDGQMVLRDREQHLPEISAAFRSMSRKAREKIIRALSEVNRRATAAVALTEVYVYESTSRFRWAQLRGLDLTLPSVTGIAGTSELGMNWAQLIWRALNHYQDQHERREQDWEHAKFIGSCLAGKGISKIYQKDADRRLKERQERDARRERVIRHVLFGEPLDSLDEAGQITIVARTEEELAEQLERSLRGEKDWHDLVVEAEWERQRSWVQQQRDLQQQQLEEWEKEHMGKYLVGSTDMQGLTEEQVREAQNRRKQLEAQAFASMQVPVVFDDAMQDFHEKWGFDTERDPSSAQPIAPTRNTGTPFRR